MALLFTIFMRVLVTLFTVGIVGSAVVVSITFVDQSKNPVPNGVWSSAYGFRLTHRQNVMINVAMICGN